MDWFWYVTLALTLFLGLGLNIMGLPGLWLMVGAHGVYAWATGGQYAGWTSSLILLGLALLAEAAEFLAGAAGSKTAGGTIRSTLGAIVGGVVGGLVAAPFPPPVISAIFGACIGSFLGAAALESTFIKRDIETTAMHWQRVHRVGWGAFKGRLAGILLKTGVGLVMLVVSLWTAWFA